MHENLCLELQRPMGRWGLLQSHGAGKANPSLKTSHAEELPWISARLPEGSEGTGKAPRGPVLPRPDFDNIRTSSGLGSSVLRSIYSSLYLYK